MPSRPDPKEIEAVLLGGEARYTRDEAVRLSGASPEFAARVWRALGFAARGDEAPAFTDSDVEALRITAGLLSSGLLDDDAAVRLARAMGQTMTRLAEWQTSILSTLSYAPEEEPDEKDLGSLVGLAGKLLPDVEKLLVHIWRRQLAASASRSLAVLGQKEDVSPNYFPLVVGFADLVSFTTLSRELDEVGLADVVEGFEATSADIVASSGGRVVKTLGDEILYVTDTPGQAAEIALQLADGVKTHVEVPDVRVGIAYGPVLAVLGDVFGTTVNRASRLTSFARPGTVLVDDALAALLKDESAYQVVAVRARHAHGLGQLQPYALRRSFEASAPQRG
ncbi:adenylate/guanylate cyclase domain-containing protein [Actinorugispora endophytica]|uniref:Adenylate cyclase n=1 Tax=Actinorugispora endophytica TaxID=1605990 RepID=A0A4R6UZZ0_9ACTN|nr:adenylate/guanylate cyclase domain-containing protein [Actinorugispora endophytica]TDQ51896.1 adenylate cyclase [Actinorugispora endophytica]